ncbi:extensin [Iris pallida]|uniref:Extensin n=1 Tax=Iris pallida TaxID=29817 RepID=A0AAX6GR04_IRIPA|nr:extensin [Iris pallida]
MSLFDWLNSTPKLVVQIRNFQLVKFYFEHGTPDFFSDTINRLVASFWHVCI